MSIAVLQDKIRARKTPLALVLSPEADKLNPKITKNFTDLYGCLLYTSDAADEL